jgi:predicted CXXCH cytochrome family protein
VRTSAEIIYTPLYFESAWAIIQDREVQLSGKGIPPMKQYVKIFLLLGISGLSTLAQSATFEIPGPKEIVFQKGTSRKPFQHWKHQKWAHNDCQKCHDYGSAEGKITGWGKDVAHELCISCHVQDGKGPVRCIECHDK